MSLAAAMSQLADEITRTTRDRRDALARMRRATTASLADFAGHRREVAQRHVAATESYLGSLRDDVMSLRAAAAKELEAHAEARTRRGLGYPHGFRARRESTARDGCRRACRSDPRTRSRASGDARRFAGPCASDDTQCAGDASRSWPIRRLHLSRQLREG